MPAITYTLTRGEDSFELDVEYQVAPLIPASGPDMSGPGSPEEGGEITDMTVTLALSGEAFELTDEERDKIEVFIYEHHDYSDTGFDWDDDDWGGD